MQAETAERKKFQEPVWFLFKKMWRFAKGYRGRVILVLVAHTMSNLVWLLTPLVFGLLLNELQRSGLTDDNIQYVLLLVAGILGVSVSGWAFHGPARVLEEMTAFRIERAYREYLLRGVLALGLSWHAGRDSGDTIDKVNKASEGLRDFSSNIFLVMRVLVQAIGTTAILFFFNVYIGLLAIVFLVVSAMVLLRFDLWLIEQYERLNVFDNKISARIFDALSNITTVKVLHIEKPIFEGIRTAIWAPLILFRRNKILVEWKWFSGSALLDGMIALSIGIYIMYLYHNELPVVIGTLSALFLYTSRFAEVFFTFAGEYNELIVRKTYIANAAPIEESFAEISERDRKAAPQWQQVQFANVTFRYADAERETPHVDSVSFVFRRGENIALIGESGSGKTTFLKVLHGMYPNARAMISFDGKKAARTNFANLDLRTTLVPQEPELFSASIRENITLGLDYSDEDIFAATDVAECTNVIHGLPKGLESVVNEKGVNLSGGQKQRIALARAILFAEGKDIILLDESTSSVDPETEARIYQNIFHRFDGKTVLASVHKMNLLKYFDRVVMFADGKIVDEGTFDDLLARNDAFRRAWEEYVAQHRDA